jgi:hypothetical protein
MTSEDLDGVNATVLWINLKTGVLPLGVELQSTRERVMARKGLEIIPASGPAEEKEIRRGWLASKAEIAAAVRLPGGSSLAARGESGHAAE